MFDDSPPNFGDAGILRPSIRTKVLPDPSPLKLRLDCDLALEPDLSKKEPATLIGISLNTSAIPSSADLAISSWSITITG